MREIKFRAWNKATAIMHQNIGIHPHLMLDLSAYDEHYHTHEDGRYLFTLNEKDIIIMQYTGLKDKDGIEIYEGDIFVSITNKEKVIAEIIFSITDLQYQIKNIKGYALMSPFYESIQVIGNIYQNPELLK